MKGEIDKFIYPTDSTPARTDTSFFDSVVIYTVEYQANDPQNVVINNVDYSLTSNLDYTYVRISGGGSSAEKIVFRNDSLIHQVNTNAGGDYYRSLFLGKKIE